MHASTRGDQQSADPVERSSAERFRAEVRSVAALGHPSAGVRRNAAQVLAGRDGVVAKVLGAKLLEDADPQVRLAALLALSTAPASDAAGQALAAAVLGGLGDADRWIGDAATAAAAAHAPAFLAAIGDAGRDRQSRARPAAVQLIGRIAEHLGRSAPRDGVGTMLARFGGADPKVADALVLGLARGWPRDAKPTLTDADEKALAGLLPRLTTGARSALLRLAGVWGSKGLERYAAEIAGSLLAEVKDPSKSDEARVAAARQLVEFRPADGEAAGAMLSLINPRTSPALGSGLIAALARGERTATARKLLEALPSLTPAARAEALRALVGRDDWAVEFLTAVEGGTARLDAGCAAWGDCRVTVELIPQA
ncbi:MAG: hypothetical protein K2X91_14095, partial [Thermoleophilia bacterium]|nr:hypothetical protein [Thermoleophilia bacterium]